MASMYDCIRDDLKKQQTDVVTYTMDEINNLIKLRYPSKELPASALTRKEWWSNNTPSHTQCLSWEAAGFKVDSARLIIGESVTFVR